MTEPTIFDSRDMRCKEPYGAVASGTRVRFTLRPPRAEGYSWATLSARFEFREDQVVEIPMPWTGLDGAIDLFSCTLDTGDYVGLVWYTFTLARIDGKKGEQLGPFQLTVYDGEEQIPALPTSFERNSDLSGLSWDALDERLPLAEIRARYEQLISKPRIDPIFVLLTVGLANASFCRLFGGDWTAMSIVFTSTLVGFAAKQRMQAHGLNHFLTFIISSFLASLCASIALRFDCTSETALATSVLFLVPGVPLINGVIDIVEGHILIGCSRLINALLLIICIAVGMSATLMMVKDSLL